MKKKSEYESANHQLKSNRLNKFFGVDRIVLENYRSTDALDLQTISCRQEPYPFTAIQNATANDRAKNLIKCEARKMAKAALLTSAFVILTGLCNIGYIWLYTVPVSFAVKYWLLLVMSIAIYASLTGVVMIGLLAVYLSFRTIILDHTLDPHLRRRRITEESSSI